uniref:RRM domain-containing protein n=1 Tax=Stegastes partitus TaxID=144197 RepID=A0A3B4ZAB9_9TELE
MLSFCLLCCVFSPLTKVKLINELNEREADLGVKESVSWHSEYKDSAWIFVGGFPYELTEGDLICVFSQCVPARLTCPAAAASSTQNSRLCFLRQVRRNRQHQPGARQEDGEVQRVLLRVLRGPAQHHPGRGQLQRHQGDAQTCS